MDPLAGLNNYVLSQGWTLSGAAWLAEPVGVSLSDLSSTSTCPLLGLDGLNGLHGLNGHHGLFARTNFQTCSYNDRLFNGYLRVDVHDEFDV